MCVCCCLPSFIAQRKHASKREGPPTKKFKNFLLLRSNHYFPFLLPFFLSTVLKRKLRRVKEGVCVYSLSLSLLLLLSTTSMVLLVDVGR